MVQYFPKLKGRNIFLSPINETDSELYTKWMNDLHVTIALGNASLLFSLQKEKELLESLAREGYHFAIVKKDEERLLGNCSLFNISHIHNTADLGIFIGEEVDRSKGYGQEALTLLLSYGFKILNLNNIMLRLWSFNTRALKCYQKVGFRQCGIREQAYLVNGVYHDEIYMEILRNHFSSTILTDILPAEKVSK